ncbi:hypothetical protein ABBQ38_003999 [Trebouxia sp. C0009 RCD-2024]
MGAWNPIKLACLERQDGLLPWVTSREDLQAIQGEEGPDGCCAQALMHHASIEEYRSEDKLVDDAVGEVEGPEKDHSSEA